MLLSTYPNGDTSLKIVEMYFKRKINISRGDSDLISFLNDLSISSHFQINLIFW